MTEKIKSLREAMADRPEKKEKTGARAPSSAEKEAITRESTIRYRGFVTDINRSSDTEMERALQRS